jgi:hypothetical protein
MAREKLPDGAKVDLKTKVEDEAGAEIYSAPLSFRAESAEDIFDADRQADAAAEKVAAALHNRPSLMTETPQRRRERLYAQIIAQVSSWSIPRAGRAARLGLTETQLDELMAGRFDRFTLFTLDDIARIGVLTGVVETFR